MEIDVITYNNKITSNMIAGKVCIVLDVFRATTTMLVGLANGVSDILILDNYDDAKKLKGDYILVGEKNMIKFPGFDLGNSPYEVAKTNLKRNNVAMVTTNGTHALKYAGASEKVFVGAFVNVRRLSYFLSTLNPEKIMIICAGSKGSPSLEDTLCAGAFIYHLMERLYLKMTLNALAAFRLYLKNSNDLSSFLKESIGFKQLLKFGFYQDIQICLHENYADILAEYKNGFVSKVHELTD